MSHTPPNYAHQPAHINEVSVTPHDTSADAPAADNATKTVLATKRDTWKREIADLWLYCAAYRKDRELTKGRGMKNAPRIPDTILDTIRRHNIDVGRAVSALGVQQEHLRNALINRDVSFEEKAETDSFTGGGSVVEGTFRSEVEGNSQSTSDADADYRNVRGEDAKLRLHVAVLDYYERHAAFPSKSYLQKHYRIASATCRKYWPTLADLGIADMSPDIEAPQPIVPVPQQAEVGHDLVMKISSLVFSDEFVEGTYDDAGTPRCDHVENDEKGVRLFVHAWRKQLDVVEKIIRLAGELQVRD